MGLTIKNLTKSFSQANIITDFNFSFPDTGLYFVIGESGIGKTTLLRLIAGLDNDFSGTIENGGIGNVSFMFQEYRLFPTLNALMNVSFGDNDIKDKATALMMKLGFERDDLSKKPNELSGGMKQRVAFARAVLKKSPILLLDEPTKELDQNVINTMIEIIRDESGRRLVIVVTHDEFFNDIENAQIIRL